MDEREKDTREKIETLKAALAGAATAETMLEHHRIAELALDFRSSDEIAGLPPVDEALIDELRALSRQTLLRAAEDHREAAIELARRVLGTGDPALAAAAWPALTRQAPGDESGALDVLLSYMWTRGLAGPDGCDGDEDEARRAALRSAEKDNADGLFEAAVLVGRSDPDTARTYVTRAAALGQPRAMFNEGFYAETGDRVAQDDGVAFAWYRKAADLGHIKAAALVGIKCFQGRGHDRDPEVITKYLGIAHDGGFPWASLAEVLGVSDDEIAEMLIIAGIESDEDEYEDEDS